MLKIILNLNFLVYFLVTFYCENGPRHKNWSISFLFEKFRSTHCDHFEKRAWAYNGAYRHFKSVVLV